MQSLLTRAAATSAGSKSHLVPGPRQRKQTDFPPVALRRRKVHFGGAEEAHESASQRAKERHFHSMDFPQIWYKDSFRAADMNFNRQKWGSPSPFSYHGNQKMMVYIAQHFTFL